MKLCVAKTILFADTFGFHITLMFRHNMQMLSSYLIDNKGRLCYISKGMENSLGNNACQTAWQLVIRAIMYCAVVLQFCFIFPLFYNNE